MAQQLLIPLLKSRRRKSKRRCASCRMRNTPLSTTTKYLVILSQLTLDEEDTDDSYEARRTHLLKLGNQKYKLDAFLSRSRNPEIRTKDALLLCQFFSLKSDPIEKLLQRTGSVAEPDIVQHERDGEVPSQEAAFEGSPHSPEQFVSLDDGQVYTLAAGRDSPGPSTSRRRRSEAPSRIAVRSLGGGSSLLKLGQPNNEPRGISKSFIPLDWISTEEAYHRMKRVLTNVPVQAERRERTCQSFSKGVPPSFRDSGEVDFRVNTD
ncbi:hypothetical protein B0H63DRAFT_444762 [Podospora didyma]|uniref:Uncharacterized protein n=1 Tax=Podospora didyma TaxID=330526 RepID=A0AAE0U8N5_9PEZI|nr:hypothetical protein B0H63DRAFT_444762 [Podospora didyma]